MIIAENIVCCHLEQIYVAIYWLGKAITSVKQLILLLLSGKSRQSGESGDAIEYPDILSPWGDKLNDTVFGIYWDTKCSGHVNRLHFISQ